ncbi:MAG: glycoside hydrolase family 15 protein [Thermoplasmataceae archaeon]
MSRDTRVPFSEVERTGYTLISNHGIIASNRTAALVSLNGSIDWACMPNFNSDPVFCSILDKDKGGVFTIRPFDTTGLEVSQSYLEHTNILVTEFYRNREVCLRLTDFLPTSEYSTINFPEIHRYVESPRTETQVYVKIKPVLDFGRKKYDIFRNGNGFLFRSEKDPLGVSAMVQMQKKKDYLEGKFSVGKGDSTWIVLLHGVTSVQRVSDYKSYERMQETARYWKDWVSDGNYPALYSREIIRSALTLKGLFFEPTGLMVAAPTASLPEYLGGERNWDYRYAWIRDTNYVIEALSIMGYKKEAIKFLYDMMETFKRQQKLKTLYPINDLEPVDEFIVDMEGYMGSKPVRFGNEAANQLQIDEYGSLVDSIYHMAMAGGTVNSYLWNFVRETLSTLTEIWKNPDSTIWEFRTEPKHYTYSKAMAFLSFRRAIEMGRKLDFSAPYHEWQTTADAIKADILKNGYSPETNSFVQYYGASHTDSALLRLPLLGLLPPTDPRMVGTVQRIEKELMHHGFLFKRYNNDDGITSGDNAFILTSFWYVEDLILMRKYELAKEVFEKLLSASNHLGLYSEEIDLDTLEALGNFPQALSHLGLIKTADRLNQVRKSEIRVQKKIRRLP